MSPAASRTLTYSCFPQTQPQSFDPPATDLLSVSANSREKVNELCFFSRKRLAIPEPHSRYVGRVTTFRDGASKTRVGRVRLNRGCIASWM